MSVLTLYNGGSLGVHVVDMGVQEEEPALKSWDGGCRGDEEYVEELVKEEVVKVSRRQMALIYSLQLAEAYVRIHCDGTVHTWELTDFFFFMCTALSLPVYNHSCTCCCGIPSCAGASTRHTGPDWWRQSSPSDLLLVSSGEG
jgi:hypothetical protein